MLLCPPQFIYNTNLLNKAVLDWCNVYIYVSLSLSMHSIFCFLSQLLFHYAVHPVYFLSFICLLQLIPECRCKLYTSNALYIDIWSLLCRSLSFRIICFELSKSICRYSHCRHIGCLMCVWCVCVMCVYRRRFKKDTFFCTIPFLFNLFVGTVIQRLNEGTYR